MERDKRLKLGAGIIVLSIIQIISLVFATIGYISFLNPETKNLLGTDFYSKLNLNDITIKISLVLSIITVLSLVLLLMKKSLGVYGYFVVTIVSIIFSIVMNGFNVIAIIRSLIMPIIMALIIYNKRNIFFKTSSQEGTI